MFPKYRTTWGVERQSGEAQLRRLPCFGDCLKSCYYPPPFLPVLIVLLSWLGYFSVRCSFWPVLQFHLRQQKEKWIYTKSQCWACPDDVKFCEYSSCDLFVKVEAESRRHPVQTQLSVLFSRQLALWCCHLYCYFYFYWPRWLCSGLYQGFQHKFSELAFSLFTWASHTMMLYSLMPHHIAPVWNGSSLKICFRILPSNQSPCRCLCCSKTEAPLQHKVCLNTK